MLVARAQTDTHDQLLILGLSAENRRRLMLGAPIELQISDLQGPVKIVIFMGETEESMQAELFRLIDQATVVVDGYTTRWEAS